MPELADTESRCADTDHETEDDRGIPFEGPEPPTTEEEDDSTSTGDGGSGMPVPAGRPRADR